MVEILKENARRNARLNTLYNPYNGKGCCGKRIADSHPHNIEKAVVPITMLSDPDYHAIHSRIDWQRLRCRHDFEYWAATCVRIKDKITGADVPFCLNAPQRRIVAIFEAERLADHPLRFIMLKARQWGGSTLTQMYMAWIQVTQRRNWHSLICAHVKDTSSTIRGMYSSMLASYPEELWDGDERPMFKPFEASRNTRLITGRGCRVTVGSSENQEAVRGNDYSMAHLSEVAFWSDSTQRTPEGFIRAVCGAIALAPLSLVVMESTANGVGNYFHTEWLRAEAGVSDKQAIFVPWHEIEIYRCKVDDPKTLWDSLDQYERNLWESGLTLEMIAWYHAKRREYPSHSMMQAEYPTTPIEAFVNTGHGVFDINEVERLRRGCREPEAVGELDGKLQFRPTPKGMLQVWSPPVPTSDIDLADRYVVAVDIGGRTASSDYSVVTVIDRGNCTDKLLPEVVAQWRGHIDHDRLTDVAERIARWYHQALLVVESNSLESDNSMYLLTELNNTYPNLYVRQADERTNPGLESRPGFHTNRSTKPMVISTLIAHVRDGSYIERCSEACDELVTYEQLPSGAYAAMPGHHDDMLMTRAIGLYVAGTLPRTPHRRCRLRPAPKW